MPTDENGLYPTTTAMKELKYRCKGIRISTIDEYGIPLGAREALAFALLAWWYKKKKRSNSTEITGAKSAAVLGIEAKPL